MAFEDWNIGKLNKHIEIVRLAESSHKDAYGFDDDEDVDPEVIRSCWAQVTDETGTKALESGSEFSVARTRFLVRSTPAEINTDMMVRYREKLYAIVRPPSDYGGTGRFTEIWTEMRERVT